MLQAILPDRPGSFVAVMPNPFVVSPYNERPWCVRLYVMDSFDPDAVEFDDEASARQFAEREYRIAPAAWMEAKRPGSAHTLAGILAPLWMRPVPEEERDAVIRLAYSQLPLDKWGLTIWPSSEACVVTYRAICYGFFEELDALRGPTFEPLATLGYDYVLGPAGDSRIDATDAFARVKADITHAGAITRWLPNE